LTQESDRQQAIRLNVTSPHVPHETSHITEKRVLPRK